MRCFHIGRTSIRPEFIEEILSTEKVLTNQIKFFEKILLVPVEAILIWTAWNNKNTIQDSG